MSKRLSLSLLVLLGLLLPLGLFAQEVVQTKDGRFVLLRADGTWTYLKEESPATKSTTASKPAQTAPAASLAQTPTQQPATSQAANMSTKNSAANGGPASATVTKPTPSTGNTDTGNKTPTGLEIYQGPRGGCYHYSASGKKVYGKC